MSAYVFCHAEGAARQVPRAYCVLRWYRTCPLCPHSKFTTTFSLPTGTPK